MSFKTLKQLFEKIEKQMAEFGGPPWEVVDFEIPEAPGEKHILGCVTFRNAAITFSGSLSLVVSLLQNHLSERRKTTKQEY